MKEGHYSWSNQSFRSFDSTVVQIITNQGISGFGEICPLGPSYLPSYSEGVRVGIKKLSEILLGKDPSNINNINFLMDNALKGERKSLANDIAKYINARQDAAVPQTARPSGRSSAVHALEARPTPGRLFFLFMWG